MTKPLNRLNNHQIFLDIKRGNVIETPWNYTREKLWTICMTKLVIQLSVVLLLKDLPLLMALYFYNTPKNSDSKLNQKKVKFAV